MTLKSFSPVALAALAALALAGCAAPGNTPRASYGPGAGRPAAMDMQSMCETYRKMMAASPAERQAMMEEHMKSMSMSQEMMQKHMQSMQERCK